MSCPENVVIDSTFFRASGIVETLYPRKIVDKDDTIKEYGNFVINNVYMSNGKIITTLTK